MDAKTATEFDKQYILLGNALLLGYLVKLAGIWFSDTNEEEKRQDRIEYSERRELREVLELAGAYDKRLQGPFDVTGQYRPESFKEISERLNALVNSDSDLADLCLRDVAFHPDHAKHFGITKALEKADDYELRTPLAQLGPTALTRQIKVLILEYFQGAVAIDLGLTKQEAHFIGWDGVKSRAELRKPPNWLQWNSRAVRKVRQDTGWLEDLRCRPERLIQAPILREYSQDGVGQNLAALGKIAASLCHKKPPKEPNFMNGLSSLGTMLCMSNPAIPELSDELLDKVFPDYGALWPNKCNLADADARNFFLFVCEQIAWQAVREGWAICIAEDGLVLGGHFSWVDSANIPSLSDSRALALPETLEVQELFELEKTIVKNIGTDRLWFVLTRDLVAMQKHDAMESGGTTNTLGPRNRSQVSEEARITELLSQIVADYPDKKATKSDVIEAILIKLSCSKRAANRIWEKVDKGHWSISGKPKAGSKISRQDLVDFLSR